jgi:DMSO reductase anchor subunit
MNPAYSVIAFTVASGAGLGLLAWLVALRLLGVIPAGISIGLWGLGLAFVLTAGGLMSSALHLGHPERAWRAFSQWRSSWLSREAVGAVATAAFAAVFAAGWLFAGSSGGIWGFAGIVAAVQALATVWATGMIYQSLKPIPAWHHPAVAPTYLVLALASGGTLALGVSLGHGVVLPIATWIVFGLTATGFLLKRHYWSRLAHEVHLPSMSRATGLDRYGEARALDPPHTLPNFVQREMGYQVARKHADALRRNASAAAFVVPLVLLAATALSPWHWAVLWASVAAISMLLGLLMERWLFFAEARHMAASYYAGP